jgi:hypothetical protein
MSNKIKDFDVVCDQRIIEELGTNNLQFISVLSELIDNVAAELYYCKTATVGITIGGVWVTNGKQKCLDLSQSFIEIEDDATGISFQDLSNAFSLAKKTKEHEEIKGLHEHGLGLKTAIASLGTLEYLVTKSEDDAVAHRVEKLIAQGKNQAIEDPSFDKIGTKIRIKELKPKVLKRKEDYTKQIINHLGAKYSRLLKGVNGKKLNIVLKLTDEFGNTVQDSAGQLASWEIVSQDPVYSLDSQLIDKELKSQTGRDWSAHLKFGFAPSEKETATEDNFEKRPTSHPYHSWAGIVDIIIHDRVLKRSKISEFGGVEKVKYSNNMAPYIGQLVLRKGFKTSMTKDGVYDDENWQELCQQILKLVTPLIKSRVGNSLGDMNEIEDESVYRDRLYKTLKNVKEEVYKAYTIEGCDGEIDLLVDKEIYELKAVPACGKDVYQVLYYIDTYKNAKKDTGVLIAPSFSQGCKYTADNLFKERNVRVKLKTFEEMGLI